MRNLLIAVTAAIGMIGAGGMALSSEPYLPKAKTTFDRLDANKDGMIILAEITPMAEKRFWKYDTNKDNIVSKAEIDAALQAAMERRRNGILAKLDADKDGAVTKLELDGYISAMLTGADSNGDGGVSLEETKLFKLAKWRKLMDEASTN